MKVTELVELLLNEDPEAEVWISCADSYYSGFLEPGDVQTAKVYQVKQHTRQTYFDRDGRAVGAPRVETVHEHWTEEDWGPEFTPTTQKVVKLLTKG